MDIFADISTASTKLSKMDFTIHFDALQITVLWFRIMQNHGSWLISRHTHSSYEFHFVASGSCRVRLDDGEFIASAGEFYLTAANVYHEQFSCGDDNYTEYSINYDIIGRPDEGTEESDLLDTLNNACCRTTPDSFGGIGCFQAALKEAWKQQLGYYNSIKSLIVQILVCAARALDGTEGKKYSVPHKTGGDDQRFAEIQKIINDNLCTRISASVLTSHIFLSSKQISRIIQKHTGLPTKSYINLLKFQMAKELLKDTNLSICEITEKLGFSSVYYFNQFFKRKDGYPPGVFRANVQKY